MPKLKHPFLREIYHHPDASIDFGIYPFSIPAIGELNVLDFAAGVTFLVGENGSGKSTALEAIAEGMGFNAEGGSKNFNFETRASHSDLASKLRFVKSVQRPKDGFFLRAESFYNVATQIESLGVEDSYGMKRLHEQSHGESFFALMQNRFRGQGLYLMDEPEAALSPSRQLAMLRLMNDLVNDGSQLIIATHSPILLAFPGAKIHLFDASGHAETQYQDTEHFALTKQFLNHPEKMLRELLSDE